MFPLDLRDIFLNISPHRGRYSVPGFVPEFLGFVPRASIPHGCAIS
nr:MAG TPA: hypothetical protein [Caudoviricetes sp.]